LAIAYCSGFNFFRKMLNQSILKKSPIELVSLACKYAERRTQPICDHTWEVRDIGCPHIANIGRCAQQDLAHRIPIACVDDLLGG